MKIEDYILNESDETKRRYLFDRLIAISVLGWSSEDCISGPSWRVPHFSSSWSDVALIVEVHKDFGFILSYDHNNQCWCCEIGGREGLSSKSAAEAICFAALNLMALISPTT